MSRGFALPKPRTSATAPALSIDPERLWSRVLAFVVFEVTFYYAYRYAMSFSQTVASPFWFPDSILLCALLLTGPRSWPIFVLGALPIRLFSGVAGGMPSWFLLAAFAIDSARGVLTALVLRRVLGRRFRFETIQELARFCLWAVLLIPAASALGGAAARSALGHAFWPAWQQWFFGNALAHLVVTPALLYWVLGAPWKTIRTLSGKDRLEAAIVLLGLVLTSHLAFDQPAGWLDFAELRFYTPVPFLFWAAIRFGMLGASGAIVVVAFFSVESALMGRGPFAGQSPADTALSLQHFLLLRSVPLYLIAILIEQRNAVERSLQQEHNRLAQLSRVAVLGELSGSLAHELRQPLTAILTNTQAAERLLSHDPVDLKELRDILGEIAADDRRATSIIERLRDLFQRGEIKRQRIEINTMARDALELARAELRARAVHVHTELADDLPPIIGDRVQLQQLLLNLVGNACSAMAHEPVGDRVLTVRTGPTSPAGVHITVCDSGPGIPLDHLPRVFDPFFTTRPDGIGLGLTVCRTIVNAHRGKLWAENNAGRGASFHVVLPVPEAPPS
ncbi:MAG TPA: ATP-binding protein [Methylomirabilota bacterium]|jgi:signal transduction histidine kinase